VWQPSLSSPSLVARWALEIGRRSELALGSASTAVAGDMKPIVMMNAVGASAESILSLGHVFYQNFCVGG
jgi:hypothetical protein